MGDHHALLTLVSADLAELDARLRSGAPVEQLGRGKLAEVFRWTHQGATFAIKRLPPAADDAQRKDLGVRFALYQRRLRERGVRVMPARMLWTESSEGAVPWVAQRAARAEQLAPRALRHASPGPAIALFESVLSHVVSVCDGTLGLDAQLDNWALIDGDLLFLDTTAPLIRGRAEDPPPEVERYLQPLPAPLRPLLRASVRDRLERFFHARSACVDLLARLSEQRLERWEAPFLDLANALPHGAIDRAELAAEAETIRAAQARLTALRRASARWRRLWGGGPT